MIDRYAFVFENLYGLVLKAVKVLCLLSLPIIIHNQTSLCILRTRVNVSQDIHIHH